MTVNGLYVLIVILIFIGYSYLISEASWETAKFITKKRLQFHILKSCEKRSSNEIKLLLDLEKEIDNL